MTIEIWALAFMAAVAGVFAALYWYSMSKKKELELTIRFDRVERDIWEAIREVRGHVDTMGERCSRNANNCL